MLYTASNFSVFDSKQCFVFVADSGCRWRSKGDAEFGGEGTRFLFWEPCGATNAFSAPPIDDSRDMDIGVKGWIT